MEGNDFFEMAVLNGHSFQRFQNSCFGSSNGYHKTTIMRSIPKFRHWLLRSQRQDISSRVLWWIGIFDIEILLYSNGTKLDQIPICEWEMWVQELPFPPIKIEGIFFLTGKSNYLNKGRHPYRAKWAKMYNHCSNCVSHYVRKFIDGTHFHFGSVQIWSKLSSWLA